MKKSCRSLGVMVLSFLLSFTAFSQTVTLTGNVRSSGTNDVVPAVSVAVKGTSTGTFTDDKGNFKITTSQKPPFTLVISSIGFDSKELVVNNPSEFVQVDFVPSSTLGTEVVVSASRVPERILESPVSIERVTSANIRNTPATNYYDILRVIKGVDVTYSSLTYATPSTRGFNGSGNARFNQLVDGMDNQAPGLNFSVGAFIGLTELDVDNMELLAGASSALYGPGGMNGTLLINSKNPFKYQGLSLQVKQGIMHVDKKQRASPSPYYDWGFRWGKVVTPKFAFKVGAQFIQAKDWIATDESNYLAGDASLNQYGNTKAGDRFTDPNYNGVNVYGDETNSDLNALFRKTPTQVAPGVFLPLRDVIGIQAKQAYAANPVAGGPTAAQFAGLVDNYLSANRADIDTTRAGLVSRTGYRESDVVNNNTLNFRLSGGMYYKITDNLEASLVGYWGTGNTVYTGSD
ncbi:MAG: carboxypeptidase-like regulatory domain-containing protein, partial [Gemmatimonadaceae bacterium]|nr:carboxypeptidase-like regulatory domain-containing protein [Chitinophagaceae bacterium]